MAQSLKKQGVEDSPGPGAYNLGSTPSGPRYTMGARLYRRCQRQKPTPEQKGKNLQLHHLHYRPNIKLYNIGHHDTECTNFMVLNCAKDLRLFKFGMIHMTHKIMHS